MEVNYFDNVTMRWKLRLYSRKIRDMGWKPTVSSVVNEKARQVVDIFCLGLRSVMLLSITPKREYTLRGTGVSEQ